MKSLFITTLSILLATTSLQGQGLPVANVGDVAPNFTRPLFEPNIGTTTNMVNLYDYEGEIIILEWFGWWCPFCPPAAEAVETQVLSRVGSRNANGVPLRHINLHVELPDTQQITTFMNNFRLTTVLMDQDRAAFRNFDVAATQPLFVIINGVRNAEGLQQWEVLYKHNGYGGFSFPAAEMRAAINSVNPSSDTPQEPELVVPTEAPALNSVSPFQNLPLNNNLKNTGDQSLGWIADNNFPNVYSFRLADHHAALQAQNPDTPLSNPGWIYVYPEFTSVNDGVLAYIYATTEWVWFPTDEAGYYISLKNPATGQLARIPLAAPTAIPTGDELTTFLTGLTAPAVPPTLGTGNPFLALPAVEGRKDLSPQGYMQLGSIDDSAFPIIHSQALADTQTGSSPGYAYVLSALSNLTNGLFLYLYDTSEWVNVPANQAYWYFSLSQSTMGNSGWFRNTDPVPAQPTQAQIDQLAQTPIPPIVPNIQAGNPFFSVPLEDQIKNSATAGDYGLGWISDAFPYIYSFELASQQTQTELVGGIEQTTPLPNAGWLHIDAAASILEGGILATLLATGEKIWIPNNRRGQHLNLTDPTQGLAGWSSFNVTGEKPDAATIIAFQATPVPNTPPAVNTENPFLAIPQQGTLRNTAETVIGNLGLGYIDDSRYPYVFSFSKSVSQVNSETNEPLPNAGWLYIIEALSGSEGIFANLSATDEWIWIPANFQGRYFNLSNPQMGVNGWNELPQPTE